MALRDENFLLVVSIDFGTSRSGFAYVFRSDERIRGWTDWAGQPVPYSKTPTHLLYSPKGEVVAWGWQARKKLAELQKSKQSKDYIFVSNFKMELHNPEKMTEEGPLITVSGNDFLVIDLIADYLRELKKFALEKIQPTRTKSIEDRYIKWCLTVPAIWSDLDKELMRRAAQKAGLIGESKAEQDRLVLAFEPEAAAIFCQLKDQIPALTGMQSGTRFMVVDAGGGTIDLVTYEIVSVSGKVELKGVCPPTGSADGSIYVDDEFLQHLRYKLTDEVITRFDNDYPLEYLQLMDKWEEIKCSFDPQQNDEIIYFPLPIRLYNLLRSDYPRILEHLANQQDGDVENIFLNRETMNSFFKPKLDALVERVKEQFAKLNDQKCDYIFLVGGFSNSPLLQQCIRQKFEKQLSQRTIVTPPNLSAAIVEGAAYFGLNEGVTVGRVSFLTYGIGEELPFEPNVDKKSKKVRRGLLLLEQKCKDRFSIIVQAGEYVGVNDVKTITTCADRWFQTEILIRFYTTREKKPRYIDDPEVSLLGEIKIDISDIWKDLEQAAKKAENINEVIKNIGDNSNIINNISEVINDIAEGTEAVIKSTEKGIEYFTNIAFNPKNWQVEIKIFFGKTEIKVEAKDSRTGKILPAIFNFSYTYFPDEIGG